MKKGLLSIALATSLAAAAMAGCGSSGSGSSGSTTAAAGSSAAGTSAAAEATTAAASGEDVYWTVAAPPASSALYPLWVSFGDAISKAYPQYKITVSESQGAVAITKSVAAGTADLGNSVSSSDYESYNGTGTFEGHANPDARILFYYEVTGEMFCVTQDSGITDLAGLDGQKFNPGGTGTSAADLCMKILDMEGIKPDYFEASQADAADAYANREIVGTVKLGPATDSYVMQLAAALPVSIIDMPDDQINRIIEKYPYLVKFTVPGGTYDGIPDDRHSVGTPQGCQTTTKLSQQDGYNICKAIFDTQKATWQAAYPTGKDNDLVGLTLASSIPLHAGTVQYLKEIGEDVPENLIPEEYVEVQ